MIAPEIINKFINYAQFNADGDIVGISKDATKSAQDAYRQYVRQQKMARKSGIKL